MSGFEEFFKDLEILAKKHKQNKTLLKVEHDFDDDIIKVFGEKITSLSRAKNGLSELSELALTTAEHHPYWNILYNSTEIISVILEKWDEEISKKDISDLEWAIKEINQTIEKIKEQNSRQR